MAEIDKVTKPDYSGNKNITPDLKAGSLNASSLMNIFAVMLAEGSGDPQVKKQVLTSLAERRAAVEQEAANRSAFENDVAMQQYRAKLGIATEVDSESAVPSKVSAARTAKANADVAEGTAASTIAATTATNTTIAKVNSAPSTAEDQIASATLTRQIQETELAIKRQELEDSKNPRLKELRLRLAELQVEAAKYQSIEAAAKAGLAGGGFGKASTGLTASQHLSAINNDVMDSARKLPPAAKARVAQARDMVESAPMWLQNMRFSGKYAEESIDPITGMMDPTKGEVAYADMITAVVPVMQKITSGDIPTAAEGKLLLGAIEEGSSADPLYYDNIVDEIARSMKMIDPDTFGAGEPVVPGAAAVGDTLEATTPADSVGVDAAQQSVARTAAINLLAHYGITKELMDQHKITAQKMLHDQQTRSIAEDAFKRSGPTSKSNAMTMEPRGGRQPKF